MNGVSGNAVSSKVFIAGARGFVALSGTQSRGACGLWGLRQWGLISVLIPNGPVGVSLTEPGDGVKALRGTTKIINCAGIVSNTAIINAVWAANVKGTVDLDAASAASGA